MQLKVDWAWGLSFLVTLFTLFNGGVLMRAGAKIDECVRGSQGIGGSVVIRITDAFIDIIQQHPGRGGDAVTGVGWGWAGWMNCMNEC